MLGATPTSSVEDDRIILTLYTCEAFSLLQLPCCTSWHHPKRCCATLQRPQKPSVRILLLCSPQVIQLHCIGHTGIHDWADHAGWFEYIRCCKRTSPAKVIKYCCAGLQAAKPTLYLLYTEQTRLPARPLQGQGASVSKNIRDPTRLQEAVACTLKFSVLPTSVESLKPSANVVSASSVEQALLHRGTAQDHAAGCRCLSAERLSNMCIHCGYGPCQLLWLRWQCPCMLQQSGRSGHRPWKGTELMVDTDSTG